jgi:hypothetical protein
MDGWHPGTPTLAVVITSVSALTLLLELVQGRVLSVACWYHLVYFVITMALLGFAASGSALASSQRIRRASTAGILGAGVFWFSVSAYAATWLACHTPLTWAGATPSLATTGGIVIVYTICMVPYGFSGLVIGVCLQRFPDRSGLLYFFNLLGSAIGCVAFVIVVGPIGAARLLALMSLAALAVAAFLARASGRGLTRHAVWAAVLAILACLPENHPIVHVTPEVTKLFWKLIPAPARTHEYLEWNPVARVDVIGSRTDGRRKYILMDGDAMAMLYAPELAKEMAGSSQQDLVYAALSSPPGRVLIVGAGGGLDVRYAVLHGAGEVDAVEINPATARIVRDLYSDHLEGLFRRPDVHLHVEDGRSFVSRTTRRYDAIVMFATDSLAALSTGAYVLSDTWLYTVESLSELIARLTDRGILQIGRWFYNAADREALRIFATALTACGMDGGRDPLTRTVVVAERDFASVFVKRTPFTAAEYNRLASWCHRTGRDVLWPVVVDLPPRFTGGARPFRELAHAMQLGRLEQFYRNFPYDVRPVTDESPFFYEYNRWGWTGHGTTHAYYDSIRGAWSQFVLGGLLLQSVVLSLAVVLVPGWLSRWRAERVAVPRRAVAYFGCLGAGFMLTQMGLVQRFVLILGHPSYSLALTIPSLLASAALGSFLSRRLIAGRMAARSVACLACCAATLLIVAAALAHRPLAAAIMSGSFGMRALWTCLLIAPLGIVMGLPFPCGLAALGTRHDQVLPFAWAANGATSVIASVLAVAIAMAAGFTTVVLAGATFYAAAALAGPTAGGDSR